MGDEKHFIKHILHFEILYWTEINMRYVVVDWLQHQNAPDPSDIVKIHRTSFWTLFFSYRYIHSVGWGIKGPTEVEISFRIGIHVTCHVDCGHFGHFINKLLTGSTGRRVWKYFNMSIKIFHKIEIYILCLDGECCWFPLQCHW